MAKFTTQAKSMLNLQAILMFSFLALFSLAATNVAYSMTGNQGGWVSKQKNISGGWKIDNVNGKTRITFTDSFKTNRGPDLKIFLSQNDISALNGNNAINNAVLVSALKSSSGGQVYELPSNINIDNYRSLIIHCESFSVLWGGANI